MEDNNKQALPINSDVLQGKTAVSAPVKKAESSSGTSESKAEQSANLKRNKPPERTKKASAAARKPQPVPEAIQTEKPAEASVAIPRFNLAEKILAEQRSFASERRRKAGPGGAAGIYAADDTLGAVIREVKDNMARPIATAAGDNPADCETGGKTAEAVASQRRLITDIVARDVAALYGQRCDSLKR